MMWRIASSLVITSALFVTAAAADEWYAKVEPGPFFDPVDIAGNSLSLVPFDLDPAEGAIEDYSGWYGTPAMVEESHAYDQHNATAFVVAIETEVKAAADGIVVDLVDGVPVGDPNAANYVWIAHDDTGEWESSYWSLYPSVGDHVQIGDEVAQGDVIALSDGIEDEIGPHVDLGTWLWGEAVDPFYWGYWVRGLNFMQGVLQYQDAPIYVDVDSTSDNVGWQSNWYAYCGTQRNKEGDGWYRYWHPTDWGTAVAALDRHDDLENPEDYDETGTWESVAAGSRADHVVGFASRGASDTATATFVPRLTTAGEYEVLTTYGNSANADQVTWRIVHAGGEDLVTTEQHGGGTGTWDEPRVVTASPYADDDDLRRSGSYYLFTYSCDEAPDLSGPEMVYRLDLGGSAEVTAALTHDDDVQLDVALLSEVDDGACLAWGDTEVSGTVGAGTVYVVVDTPVDEDDQSFPGAFELTVSYSGSPAGDSAGPESGAHQWHSLGTYEFADGKDAATSAIVLEVPAGLGGTVDNPARAVADTVLLLNTDRLPYAWGEEGPDEQIAEDALILKEYALLGIRNAGSWPVRTEPSDDAPVLFRAKRGQRFMAGRNYEGWYEMYAPGLAGEIGYLHEDCCFLHHPLPITDLDDWVPPTDDDDDDSAAADDDDGCDCDAAARPSSGVVGTISLLLLLVVMRRRR